MSGQLIGDLLSVGGKVQQERDRLAVELRESELLRKEAAAFSETMRQELAAVTLERDEWKTGAEYAQQQVTQLRQQVAALEASLQQEQGRVAGLQQTAQANFAIGEHNHRAAEQLRSEVAELQAKLEGEQRVSEAMQTELNLARAERNAEQAEGNRLFGLCNDLRKHLADLQAQLEAASVTPVQQPDGTAERLERVRRMIGEIRGWYVCVGYLDEIKWAEAWEQVGALLGLLQREAD